jgi:hypothetical protein
LIELLLPPTLPGPAGTPLMPVVPAPADPALGVPAGLAPPAAPCANEVTGAIKVAMMASVNMRGDADI